MSKSIPEGKNTKYVPAAGTDYVIDSNDDYIFVNTSLNSKILYLPNIKGAGLDFSRKKFIITDNSNNAAVKNITIYPSGSNTLNSGSSITLAINGGSIECEPNGPSDWTIEGSTNTATTGQSTGTAINFRSETIYGTIATPGTGNITADLTGAVLGNCELIIHNAGTEPTYPATFKKSTLSGDYVTGSVNYIYVTYIDATHQIYSISQTA